MAKERKFSQTHLRQDTLVMHHGPRREHSTRVLLLQFVVLWCWFGHLSQRSFATTIRPPFWSGAWQLARHQTSFLHAVFYNFDKQWGVFLALSWLYRFFPHADPVLAANVLMTVLASLAWISLGFRMGRTRNVPLPLVLPVLLSPVLILYIPYLGSAWFSLAFLLLAFFFLGRPGSRPMLALGIIAVAARRLAGEMLVLAIPALAISQMFALAFLTMVRRPLLGFSPLEPFCRFWRGKPWQDRPSLTPILFRSI